MCVAWGMLTVASALFFYSVHQLSQASLCFPCNLVWCILLQDVDIDEEVDIIISEWMGYMLLYEVNVRYCYDVL